MKELLETLMKFGLAISIKPGKEATYKLGLESWDHFMQIKVWDPINPKKYFESKIYTSTLNYANDDKIGNFLSYLVEVLALDDLSIKG